MSLLGRVIMQIENKIRAAKKRRQTLKELKDVETQAYNRQKEIQEETKWEEKRKQAELRGIERAQTTSFERAKTKIEARREKVKARNSARAAAASNEGRNSEVRKKDMSALLPVTNKTASMISLNSSKKQDFSELLSKSKK